MRLSFIAHWEHFKFADRFIVSGEQHNLEPPTVPQAQDEAVRICYLLEYSPERFNTLDVQ